MIEPTQILLVVVVIVLTVLLTIIGIQVFYILREVKRSMEKINQILDNATLVSSSVTKQVTNLSNSLSGLSGLFPLVGLFLGRRKKKEEKNV